MFANTLLPLLRKQLTTVVLSLAVENLLSGSEEDFHSKMYRYTRVRAGQRAYFLKSLQLV